MQSSDISNEATKITWMGEGSIDMRDGLRYTCVGRTILPRGQAKGLGDSSYTPAIEELPGSTLQTLL